MPRTSLKFACFILVITLSYFTYFHKYWEPTFVFWDENYHIASAQKYLAGVFFMEPHPPLGKLLIALGEKLLAPNTALDLSYFLSVDHIKEFPKNYSFTGVRLFPALFAWFSAILFFSLVLQLTRHYLLALLCSSLFIFDNALIVHFRGAMLDGIQIFFVLASLLCFFRTWDSAHAIKAINYFWLCLLIGFSLCVKANSTILLLLPLILLIKVQWAKPKDFLLLTLGGFFGLALPLLLVWQVHFSLGKSAQADRFYRASPEYKSILAQGKNSSLINFPIMLRDNIDYFFHYQRGVPAFDPCKSEENGSLPLEWIVGKKSINYRWEKFGADKVQYLYLQINPVIWLVGLVGLSLSIVLVGAHYCFGLSLSDRRVFSKTLILLLLYLSYMGIMLQLDRVMYLYHYFIPLLLSELMACCIFKYIYQEYLEQSDILVFISLGMLVLLSVVCYFFYAPLTYYKPINAFDFYARVWFDFWKLSPIL